MILIERYIFRQLITGFLAILGLLSGVVWVTQALRELDLITTQGQTLGVFGFITLLSMPLLVLVIAPVALMIAYITVLNRLNSDSELVIMNAAGLRPVRLLKPFLLAGICVSLLIAAMSLYLSPLSQNTLRFFITQVRADLITTVIRDGTFAELENGLTFHVRDRGPGGILTGILVSDKREPRRETTYFAENGQIVESGEQTFLVMQDGAIHQRPIRQDGLSDDITTVAFDQYALDLSRFNTEVDVTFFKPRERSTLYLLDPDENDKLYNERPGQFRAELHDRLSAPLYPLAFMAIVLAFMGQARTTRQRRALALISAIACAAILRITGFALTSLTATSSAAVPLLYALPIGTFIVGIYIMLKGRRLHLPKRLAQALEAACGRIDGIVTPVLRKIGFRVAKQGHS
jgi:lipopolysaccharide export system permease protein